MHISIITDINEFKSLKTEWSTLFNDCFECYPMLSHTWLCAWWEAFSTDDKLYIITIWSDNKIIAGAPLMYKEAHIFGKKRKVISFLANVFVDRITFLLISPFENSLKNIVDHLYNDAPEWDLIKFRPMADDSPVTAQFLSLIRDNSHCVGIEKECLASPYLTLPKNRDELLKKLSSSFRQSVRRKGRKIQKLDDVKFSICNTTSCIEPLMDISLNSWQHDNGTSMASNKDVRHFYEKIIVDAADSNTLRVGLLEIDKKPVAFEFNLICRSTLHNFKLGFNKEYARYSPGIPLKMYVLESIMNDKGSENKIAEYDLMGAKEPYKLNWTKKIRLHSSITVFQNKFDLFLVYIYIYRIKPILRKLLTWFNIK